MSKNYNSTLQTNNSSLEEIITQLNSMPDADGAVELQDKTVTPTTSKQTITADSGYDGLDTVTVNAMPTATQAAPIISVNSSTGLITATATQTAGYVTAGTKSATMQLAFQAAKTITPGRANQTAVAANTYVGGAVTVKGDSNLVASNIVSGKSIFGVVGTATAGGGEGDTSVEDAFVTRTFTTYTNDRVSSIGDYVFYSCSSLTSVNFPACTSIGSSAFAFCFSLKSINFPVCTSIYNCAFQRCSSLTSVNFPACTFIGNSAFYYCLSLTRVSLPVCTLIGGYAFQYCSKLTSIYLMASTVCSLANSSAFSTTGITSSKGSIFVPTSLVASYKAATNWTYFSNRIFGA